jgi:hypothetical protein
MQRSDILSGHQSTLGIMCASNRIIGNRHDRIQRRVRFFDSTQVGFDDFNRRDSAGSN